MKHLTVNELKAFFKNALDEHIDRIAGDSKALGLFVTRSATANEYFLVAVGDGYPCKDIYTLIRESALEEIEVVGASLLPRNPEKIASQQTAAPTIKAATDPDREKALDAREEKIIRLEKSLSVREKQVRESEEELKKIAEQQMEDLAREEMA